MLPGLSRRPAQENYDATESSLNMIGVNQKQKKIELRSSIAVRSHKTHKQETLDRGQAAGALGSSEEKFRCLIETVQDGILLLDAETGIIIDANSVIEKMLGCPGSELIDKRLWEIEAFKGIPAVQVLFQKSGRKKYFRYEDLLLQAEDGRRCRVDFVSTAYRVGDKKIIQCNIRDITDRKRAEEAMAHQAEELDRLYRASGSLLSSNLFDLQGLAQTIVHVVQQEFGQTNCSVFLVQEDSNVLKRIAVAGPYADQVRKAQLTLDGPGLVPKAIRSGKVINIPDVKAISAYVPNWDAARAELTLPLLVSGRVIGAMDVQSDSPDAFSAKDVRLMSIFAERFVLALEHARLYAEKERRMQNIASLRTIDLAISNSFDIHFTLGVLLDQVTQQLHVDAADVLLFSPATQTLRYSHGQGFRTRALQHIELQLDDPNAGRAVRERQVITIQDLDKKCAGLKREPEFLSEGFVTYVGAPLIAKGEVRGVLEIFQREGSALDQEQRAFLEMLAGQAAIAIESAELLENLQGSNAELRMAYDETIEGWSHAMDLRDEETEGHTQRVTELTLQLAGRMGFSIEELDDVRRGALLHDIGKIGVPDAVLLKPGPLTDEEWMIMRRHPQFAYDMLAPIAYLRKAVDIPYCHHEKWDGTGYPRGLKGEQIPWAARIFAVVDVWDAITSDRPYRKAWSRRKALAYIRGQSGKHFDPKVVEIFLKHLPRDGGEAGPRRTHIKPRQNVTDQPDRNESEDQPETR